MKPERKSLIQICLRICTVNYFLWVFSLLLTHLSLIRAHNHRFFHVKLFKYIYHGAQSLRRKKYLPSREITPHNAQTIIVIPTDPLYIKADDGEMKIPDPIITARMTLTAEKSPMLRLSLTPSLFLPFDAKGCTTS